MSSYYDNGGMVGNGLDFTATERYGSTPASPIIIGSAVDITDVTTYTFTVPLSITPSANDRVVVVVHGEGYSGTNYVSTVTYNGVSSPIHARTIQTGQVSNAAISSLVGDDNPTATIVATFSFQQYRAAVYVYLLQGNFSFDSASSGIGTTNFAQANLTTSANSVVILGATHGLPGVTMSWPSNVLIGGTLYNVNEQQQYDLDAEGARISGAISPLSTTPRVNYPMQVSASASGNMALVCASFVAGPSGNIKNSGLWNFKPPYIKKLTPTNLNFISSNRSTVIPTNTIEGKTQGFLGVIWQTGFGNGSFPADIVSPGWTRVSGGTGLLGGLYWRMNLQIKSLSLAELGTDVSTIPYTGGANKNIALFGTNSNRPISSITFGSVGFSAGTGALSHTIEPTGETSKLLLYLSQMYNSLIPSSPTFTGATATTLNNTSDHQLRYYISPTSEIIKPVVTTGMSSGTYNHMSAQYIGVS